MPFMFISFLAGKLKLQWTGMAMVNSEQHWYPCPYISWPICCFSTLFSWNRMAYQGSILPYTLVKPTLAFCQSQRQGLIYIRQNPIFLNRDPKWSSVGFWPQRLTLVSSTRHSPFHGGDFNRSENRTENPSLSAFLFSDSEVWSPWAEDVVTYPARVRFAPWRWPFLWSYFCPVITIE
jgi:hypothetical protein